MKTVCYRKNDKGEVFAINSKVKENPMKSIVYEKQNSLWPNYPKVFRPISGFSQSIVKVINRSQENIPSLKDQFTSAYKLIASQIETYTFNMDILQIIILDILDRIDKSTLQFDDKENPLHYLKRACVYRLKNSYRENTNFNIFKDKVTKKIDSSQDGITIDFIAESIGFIKEVLTKIEFDLFTSYHVKGYTIRELEVKLNKDKSTLNRELKKINDKIDKLHISYLYDGRYIDYTNKSKHNHISTMERKKFAKINDKEYKKQFEGICFKVDKSNYTPPEKSQVDYTNLKHTYGVWTCQKQIMVKNFGYTQVAENYTYHKISGIVKNVYSESDIIGMPEKFISWKVGSNRKNKYYSKGMSLYKLKKLKRNFSGKSKSQKRIEKYAMYLKHGRYLEYMD